MVESVGSSFSAHPLQEGNALHREAEPCILVIFGATGDLTARKLIPALYQLGVDEKLPHHFACVGFARRQKDDALFRAEMQESIEQFARIKPVQKAQWEAFANTLFYHCSDFQTDSGYEALKERLERLDRQLGTRGNRLYYLSTQPEEFVTITEKLKTHGLIYPVKTIKDANSLAPWSRVVIEKPFGYDYNSAVAMQSSLSHYLDESQCYRIDHWLGKETVQNLLVFRFTNAIFESLWNTNFIDHVQISVAEELGVGSRGKLWEHSGMLRDIVQNHVMQLLSLIAMEPPTSLSAEFFNVDYFGYTATLAQSSQLYKQIMVGVNERVFALMPFFRAENSNTPRHLTEGKQFEFEMGFFNHWHDILDVQENCIKYMIKHLNTHSKASLKALEKNLILAPENVPFPRIPFLEAQELFYQRTGIDERLEPDLSPAAERELCAWAREEFGTDLVFVTDWKTSKRPFYSAPKEDNPDLTNTFDLLCAGTEITSGGQRRHTYESMVEGIRLKGMDPANFGDYLSIFQYGMPPHGGFGMGLERLTMKFLGLNNIRETSLFPSDPKRIAGNRIKKKLFFGPETIRNEIVRQLRDGDVSFDQAIHAPFTSPQEAAASRKISEESCLKSIIVRGKTTKKNALFVLPATKRLDMKAVATLLGEKAEVEEADVIQERFGLSPHGVPPFGSLLNLDAFVDTSISSMDTVGFCCGMPTESLMIKASDLLKVNGHKLELIAT